MISFPGVASPAAFGDRNTLKGIQTICVETAVVGDAAQAGIHGVTPQSLKEKVEWQLQEAGIRIAPPDVCRQLPGKPTLQVTALVLLFPGVETHFHLTVNLDFVQEVLLARDNKSRASAPTWSDSRSSLPPRQSLWDSVKGAVEVQVNDFAQAYFIANR